MPDGASRLIGALARGLRVLAALALGGSLVWAAAPGTLPESSLAVRQEGRWTVWWRSARAPVAWAPLPALAGAVRWRAGAPGVEWGELRLAGDGEAWRVRVIVARVDPRQVRLTLDAARAGGRGTWTVDRGVERAPDAAIALNAGQFGGAVPWGWVVHRGREVRPPGTGALAPAVVVDTAGRVRLVPADSLGAVRGREAGAIVEAFQSYPALLAGGEVPAALRAPGRGVDVAHRDARLALGTLADGRVLVALTRFDALDGTLGVAPFGPTVPEMAAVMGALGARDAVLLDGGLSAQLLVRDADGVARRWPGLRRVPMGLVGTARATPDRAGAR